MLQKRLHEFLLKGFLNCSCTSFKLLQDKLNNNIQFIQATVNQIEDNKLKVTIDYSIVKYSFIFEIEQSLRWFKIKKIYPIENE